MRKRKRKAEGALKVTRRGVGVGLIAIVIALGQTRTVAAGDAQAGAKLFAQRCARCHGASGKGNGPDLAKLHLDSPPDNFTDKEINAELSDYKINKIVTGGGRGGG